MSAPQRQRLAPFCNRQLPERLKIWFEILAEASVALVSHHKFLISTMDEEYRYDEGSVVLLSRPSENALSETTTKGANPSQY